MKRAGGTTEPSFDGLEFARRMCDPTTMHTPGWEVDWRDAPSPYKLYRDVDRLPLARSPSLGRLLQRSYGLTHSRFVIGAPPGSGADVATSGQTVAHRFRRPIASGGGLYPAELYVYVRQFERVAPGLYHFDPAHQALVPLRMGAFDSWIDSATGGRLDVAASSLVLMASVFFWKNRFKYADFGYRLSAVDAGVLVGQIAEIGRDEGLASATCLQFADVPLAHLLGLDGIEESPYAVIALRANGTTARPQLSPSLSAPALPPIQIAHRERSRTIKTAVLAAQMHRASLLTAASELPHPLPQLAFPVSRTWIDLPPPRPRADGWLDAALARRSSAGDRFCAGAITPAQLSDLLHHATRPIAVDVLGAAAGAQRLGRPLIGVIVTHADGIAPGAYIFDPLRHQLAAIRAGQFAESVHRSVLAQNLNLLPAAACFHLLAEDDLTIPAFGNRGYRINQMLAGIVLGRLQLAATAAGLQGHPLLGFDVRTIGELYAAAANRLTVLAALPVGHTRPGLYLEADLPTAG